MSAQIIRYIGDLHLYDPAVIRWCPDPTERITTLISNWNNTVGEDDVTFVLGDVGYNCLLTWETLKQLMGKKILILGNHDKPKEWSSMAFSVFSAIYPHLLSNGTLLIHKPQDRLRFTDYQWCIHAHLHNYEAEVMADDHKKYLIDTYRLNCAADMIDLCPQTAQGLIYKKAVYAYNYT